MNATQHEREHTMIKVTIDCYGNRNDRAGARFNTPAGKKRPYLIDEAGNGVTYVCYDNAPRRAIQKGVKTGNITTIAWAFGEWDNRANLTYTATLNETLTVDMED